MTADLVANTLKNALKANSAPDYYHSDMGSQYTSDLLEGLLNDAGIKHSYSLQGHPYDNGPMEAYHSILKREFIFQTHFDSFEDLVVRTEAYIDWYNTQRISLKS